MVAPPRRRLAAACVVATAAVALVRLAAPGAASAAVELLALKAGALAAARPAPGGPSAGAATAARKDHLVATGKATSLPDGASASLSLAAAAGSHLCVEASVDVTFPRSSARGRNYVAEYKLPRVDRGCGSYRAMPSDSVNLETRDRPW